MISYASYLHKKSDLYNNAFITALADTGTSFLARFAVFSVVGYLALMQGVGIEQLSITGPSLTFITYPNATSLVPVASGLFGILFYLALFTFGLDSAFSVIEPITTGIQNKWRFTKETATGIICFLGFIASFIFITGGGLYWLEIVDHFISNFGLVLVGLAECLIIGWVFHLPFLRNHANKTSDIQIGRWWDILIKYIIPLILTSLLLMAIYDLITNPPTYPIWALLIGGVSPCIIVFILSFLFVRVKGKKEGN